MEKWYSNMEDKDVVLELSRISKNAIHSAKKGNNKECEKHYDELNEKFKQIIPVIVDLKTELWAYRNVNSNYYKWEKCIQDMKNIIHETENKLVELRVQF